MKKRFLSIALSLSIIVSSFAIFSGVSYAEPGIAHLDPDRFDGGNGTEKRPYEIATLEQMEYLASISTRESYFIPESELYFILTADIGSKDEPLKTCLFMFGDINDRISFDGNDKTVYVDIEYKDGELAKQHSIGLFGECINTTIKNLVLEGRIDAGAYDKVGGICGFAKGNVEIFNCENNAAITGYSEVGGICGYSAGKTTISMCMNNAAITGYSEVGGICGILREELPNSSYINHCWNTGKVKGYANNIGGICGSYIGDTYMDGKSGILYCNNKATVWGADIVGGICGDFRGLMFGCSAQGGIVLKSTDKFRGSASGGLLVGKLSNAEVTQSCAEQSDNTKLVGDILRNVNYHNSVIILPGKYVFEFPQSIKETQAYKDGELADIATGRLSLLYSVLEWHHEYYTIADIDDGVVNKYYTYEPSGDGIVWNADVVKQFLESEVLYWTLAELGATVQHGSDQKIYSKIMEIYPLWIEQIQAIRSQEPYYYTQSSSEKIDPINISGLIGEYSLSNTAEDLAELVKVEAMGDSEETLNCILEIYPDIVQELKETLNDLGFDTGTVLSKGSTGILCGISGVAIGFIAAMLIFHKRKSAPALEGITEKEIKDDE